jgi:hypothetical protein
MGWGGRNGFACCPEKGLSFLLRDLKMLSQTLGDLLRRTETLDLVEPDRALRAPDQPGQRSLGQV